MYAEEKYISSQIRIREILKMKYDFMNVLCDYGYPQEKKTVYDDLFDAIDTVVECEAKSLNKV